MCCQQDATSSLFRDKQQAEAPASSRCPRGDPFPPDDLPASSPGAKQSSITSGFLTLKLGRGEGSTGGRGREAFVCVQSHGKKPQKQRQP